MPLITDTDTLAAFCEGLKGADYITLDTEFMRESTYWPQLCLVQVAGPVDDDGKAPEGSGAVIDPLAEGIDLAPLDELLHDDSMVKVLHAARQDLEIFYKRSGRLPAPIFDSQVAAMVCGFGDQVAYDKLVAQLAGAEIDKSSRFTDWSRRPLTDRQIHYALSDVTHLRQVFLALKAQLEENGRTPWLAEEMGRLTDPRTYAMQPEDAWLRVKTRGAKPRALAVLREVAAWRERAAQERDIPRNRLLRDEALLDIAGHPPTDEAGLSRIRGMPRGFAQGPMGKALMAAIKRGIDTPKSEWPMQDRQPRKAKPPASIVELLRVLLRVKAEEHDVAQRLIATSDDLEAIAADDAAEVAALAGWRREIFGEDALALKAGKLALAVGGARPRVIPLED
ncbi:ribonuclease D [Marinibaculum pumilum]|uniref:Ribonuclease D n=1 Tax=Marinibaculum pumilum TaxID=1766165 RepID=A0ABV7L3Y8_9PROT